MLDRAAIALLRPASHDWRSWRVRADISANAMTFTGFMAASAQPLSGHQCL